MIRSMWSFSLALAGNAMKFITNTKEGDNFMIFSMSSSPRPPREKKKGKTFRLVEFNAPL